MHISTGAPPSSRVYRPVRVRPILALAALLAAGLGCATTTPVEAPPDETFGHRYEDGSPDGRETLGLTPPAEDETYFFYPAVVDSLNIRPGSFRAGTPAEGQEVPVEVLVKGAFPDACTELHEVEQARAGTLLTVTLMTRRPRGAVCARVKRPFRFYMLLDGTYPPGAYTLRFNDRTYPFVVRPPQQDGG